MIPTLMVWVREDKKIRGGETTNHPQIKYINKKKTSREKSKDTERKTSRLKE